VLLLCLFVCGCRKPVSVVVRDPSLRVFDIQYFDGTNVFHYARRGATSKVAVPINKFLHQRLGLMFRLPVDTPEATMNTRAPALVIYHSGRAKLRLVNVVGGDVVGRMGLRITQNVGSNSLEVYATPLVQGSYHLRYEDGLTNCADIEVR